MNRMDTEDIFKEMYARAKAECSASDAAEADAAYARFEKRSALGRRRWQLPLVSGAALALLVPAVLFFFRLASAPAVPEPTVWTEVVTGFAETRSLELPDGSQVKLEPCSRLLYPSRFDGRERKVYMSGDCFFDVAKDSASRFIVSVQSTDVSVYGTAFCLSSRFDRPDDQVALLRGSVKLTSKNGAASVMVSPGQIVSYDKISGSIDVENFDVQSYEAVMSCEGLQFVNQTLDEIARSLERRFGAKVVLVGDKFRNERYYATFVNGEGLDDILKALNVGHNFRVSREDKSTIKLIERI